MGFLAYRRNLLSACITFVLLAGCGGVQSQIGGATFSPAAVRQSSDTDPWIYVGGTNNAVNAYDLAAPHSPLVASITQGIDKPAGLKVDGDGTLYVANTGNGTVTEYLAGDSAPRVTLSVTAPQDTAVDPFTGNLYVDSRANPPGIAVFEKGKKRPSKFITSKLLEMPARMLFDSRSGNLYIADNRKGVSVIKRGAQYVESLKLLKLHGCTSGIAIDESTGELYVSDCNGFLQVYMLQGQYPLRFLNDSVDADYLAIGAIGTRENIFVPDTTSDTVSAYHAKAVNPFKVITTGSDDALGIAVKPANVP